jgi:hypothetical protein
MKLTKIDVAEAHIRAAVRLFFACEHPAPVYSLTCAAREILMTIGEKLGIVTLLHEYAADHGISLKEAIRRASPFANFMKHADRDPDAVLEGFEDDEIDPFLLIACKDFHKISGGMPVEAQVFEAWWHAAHTEKLSEAPRAMRELARLSIRVFPIGFRSATRDEKKRIGLARLLKAQDDPALRQKIRRVVELPEKR